MHNRIFQKTVISAITLFVLLPAVLSAIADTKKENQPIPSEKSPKDDAPLPVNWLGRSLKPTAPKLGAPQPPLRPSPEQFPINLDVKDKLNSPNNDVIGKLDSLRGSKDLKTANSYGYYSYWDLPYYHCSSYWPYYCYGYGYGYKYLPLYTSYWGKWNNYYAYPYYNYYDNYYDDFWYRR